MPLLLPKQSEYSSAPAGTHVAVCYRVIDLGTQTQDFAGETRAAHKIMLAWELSHEAMEDGRPFTIARRYTLSSNKKAKLRIDLESWRGKAFTEEEFGTFDLVYILGKGCLLGIVHEQRGENTYANVSGIMALPKGQPTPTMQNAAVYFDLSAFDAQVYASLSEGLREVIARSPEYRQVAQGGVAGTRRIGASIPEMYAPATPPATPPVAPGGVDLEETLTEKLRVIETIHETAAALGYTPHAVEKWETQVLHGLKVTVLSDAPIANLQRLLTQVQHWPDKRPAQSSPQGCDVCAAGSPVTRCVVTACNKLLCMECLQENGMCLACVAEETQQGVLL